MNTAPWKSTKGKNAVSYKNQKTENSAQPGNSESNYSFYRAAVGTAVVAGVFSVLVCLLLVRNHFQSDFTDKLESEQLEKLKEQLLENPKDELLKSRIRTFDLELRNEFFRRQKIADRGKYILLGGLIIFLLSLKIAFNYRKKSPIPRLDNTDQSAVVRTTFLSVTILAAAAVGLATFLIMTGDDIFIPVPLKEIVKEKEIVHEQPDAAKIVDYPTPEQLKKNWPRFRGPGGMGISAYTNIPKSWNGKSGESIRWKTAIPMPGENSPVVWGNRIFLNSADEKNRQVYCFDADSGSILWQKEVDKIPRRTSDPPRIMEETGFAAATAVTDGLRVYAIFANGDLICFDFKGNRVWARNLGLPENVYGFSTSLDMYQKLPIADTVLSAAQPIPTVNPQRFRTPMTFTTPTAGATYRASVEAHSLRVKYPTPLTTQSAPAAIISNPKKMEPTPIGGATGLVPALGNAPDLTAIMPSATFNRPTMPTTRPVVITAKDDLLSTVITSRL